MEIENGIFCDDILVEILVRLPKKTLARFNCVSKGWGHLISNLRRQRNDSGLVSQYFDHDDRSLRLAFHRVLEDGITVPDHALDFSFNKEPASPLVHSCKGCHFRLVDSCNGLLLIQQTCFPNLRPSILIFHVFNPATKNSVSLPPIPNRYGDVQVGLAFDGCHHYKVILFFSDDLYITRSSLILEKTPSSLDFMIFSSEIGEWTETQVPLSRPTPFPCMDDMEPLALFWKGAMHWKVSTCILIYHLEGNYCKLLPEPHSPWSDLIRSEKAWLLELEEGLHYCRIDIAGLHLWALRMDGWYCNHDCGDFEWQLKHFARWKTIDFEHPDAIPPAKSNGNPYRPREVSFSSLGTKDEFGIIYLSDGKIPISDNFTERKDEFGILYLSNGEISISYNFADGKLKFYAYPLEVNEFMKKCSTYPFLYNKIASP